MRNYYYHPEQSSSFPRAPFSGFPYILVGKAKAYITSALGFLALPPKDQLEREPNYRLLPQRSQASG